MRSALRSSRRRVALASAAVAAAAGLLGLVGKLLDTELLMSAGPGWALINPVTAGALALLAAIVWRDETAAGGARGRRVGWFAALAVTLVALARLAASLFGLQLPPRPDHPGAWRALGMMADNVKPAAAASLAMLGTARLLRDTARPALRRTSEMLAVGAGVVAVAALTAYAFGVSPRLSDSQPKPMAITAALGLAALSVASVAALPGAFLVRALSAEPPGGTLARRLLPSAIAVVFLLQWLGTLAERDTLYGAAVGDAIQALAASALLAALVLGSASAVNRVAAERRRAEADLRDNEGRLRAVFEHAGVGLAYVTPTGRFLQVNQRLCDILGYSAEELQARTFQEITHPEHLEADVAGHRRLVAGEGASYETEKRYLRKDGEAVWVDLTSTAVRGLGGELSYFVTAFNEISDRRRAEDRLRASEADYRGLVENATVGIFRSTVEGTVLAANPALAAMLGYGSADELVGLDIAGEVYADAAERGALLRQLHQGPVATGEVGWKRKDGGRITVRVRLRKDRGRGGESDRLEGLAEDVTQQRSLESQFRQAQRLEAVGRLAGGVAHDFNNILTAITGYSDLLLSDLPPGDPKRGDVEEIRAAAARAASLTRQLLAFSRKQVLRTRVLDLNALLRTLERMLQRLIGEDVRLETALAPDLGAVRADPGQIEQIIMNLAVNARDAMPSGGRLTIETANVVLDEGHARQHPGAAAGPHVLLAVSDTGVGMDEDTRAHLFEPFFTTKEQGKGTGLGLATVYGIVKQSGGHVWAYSEPGHGATFKIYLPRVDEAPEPLIPPPADRGAGGGTETILLAEDDRAVREIAAETLGHRGYRVLRAPEGQTALELARAHDGPIHLLVTDIVMPGMTGRDLAEALLAARAATRVLYVSGYTDDAVVRHGVLQAGLPYLQKPFTPDDLARKVREVLDRPVT